MSTLPAGRASGETWFAQSLRRIRLTIAYDGTAFHGWQVQLGLATIQAELESVLERIDGATVKVAGSGRTDAGVHAVAQVAAYSTRNRIPVENLRKAMNHLLPGAIRVMEAREAPEGFHPQFDATAKTYEYRIWRGEICPPFERPYFHHFPYPLDEQAMMAAAPVLEGEHDFIAFAAADERYGPGYSTVRTVFSSRLWREGERLLYRVRGSGFLKHMVRNMAGTLLEVGKGNLNGAGLERLWRPPARCGATAPACGLFLMCVEY